MKPMMLKTMKIGALLGGGLLVVRLLGPRMSARMDRMMEEAPDDFPPKWMYINMTAIRQNTERILEMLEKEGATAPSAVA